MFLTTTFIKTASDDEVDDDDDDDTPPFDKPCTEIRERMITHGKGS